MKISILGLEPWEFQFWQSPKFEIYHNFYDIAEWPLFIIGCDECSSYQHPFLDKLNLYRSQGLKCGIDYTNNDFPFWIKPRFSRSGLGYRTQKYEYGEIKIPYDLMWVEDLKGTLRSTDFVISDGKIKWSQTVPCHTDDMCLPRIWVVEKNTFDFLIPFVEKYFCNFTGAISIETIGNFVLDLHCRPGVQFFDLFGLEDFAGFVISNNFGLSTDSWEIRDIKEPCVSWAYYVAEDVKLDSIEIKDTENISSVQKTFFPNRFLSSCNQRSDHYRVVVINTQGITTRPKIKLNPDLELLSGFESI